MQNFRGCGYYGLGQNSINGDWGCSVLSWGMTDVVDNPGICQACQGQLSWGDTADNSCCITEFPKEGYGGPNWIDSYYSKYYFPTDGGWFLDQGAYATAKFHLSISLYF